MDTQQWTVMATSQDSNVRFWTTTGNNNFDTLDDALAKAKQYQQSAKRGSKMLYYAVQTDEVDYLDGETTGTHQPSIYFDSNGLEH